MSAGSGDDDLGMARPHHKKRVRTVPVEAEDREGTFAPPRPPYICRSRNGRWRNAHELDGRPGDAYRVCIFCDRRIKGVEA